MLMISKKVISKSDHSVQFNEFLTEISEKDFITQISAALNDFSHEAERIYSFHNANPQFFKITSRHKKFRSFRLLHCCKLRVKSTVIYIPRFAPSSGSDMKKYPAFPAVRNASRGLEVLCRFAHSKFS